MADPLTSTIAKFTLTGLKFVVNVLRSKIPTTSYAEMFLDEKIIEAIKPQLDRIQNALNDLKMKDLKIARDQFDDALRSLRQKLERLASTSEENLKHRSDQIEKELYDAQQSAIGASNSELKCEETITAIKCIVATEMLRVLNVATSSKNIGASHQSLLCDKISEASEKCNKYLNRANELKEITDYIVSKVEIEGYPKSYKFFLSDKSSLVYGLIEMNLHVRGFFYYMEKTNATKSSASRSLADGRRPVSAPNPVPQENRSPKRLDPPGFQINGDSMGKVGGNLVSARSFTSITSSRNLDQAFGDLEGFGSMFVGQEQTTNRLVPPGFQIDGDALGTVGGNLVGARSFPSLTSSINLDQAFGDLKGSMFVGQEQTTSSSSIEIVSTRTRTHSGTVAVSCNRDWTGGLTDVQIKRKSAVPQFFLEENLSGDAVKPGGSLPDLHVDDLLAAATGATNAAENGNLRSPTIMGVKPFEIAKKLFLADKPKKVEEEFQSLMSLFKQEFLEKEENKLFSYMNEVGVEPDDFLKSSDFGEWDEDMSMYVLKKLDDCMALGKCIDLLQKCQSFSLIIKLPKLNEILETKGRLVQVDLR